MYNGKHLSSFEIGIINIHELGILIYLDKTLTFINWLLAMSFVFYYAVEYGNDSVVFDIHHQMVLGFLPVVELTCPIFR